VPIARDIIPAGVYRLDQIELPLPWPFLDGLFAGDCLDEEVVFLEPERVLTAFLEVKPGVSSFW
jgi:hypothetical protein